MLLNAIVHSHCCNIPLSEYTTSYPFYIGGHLDCLQLGLSHFIFENVPVRYIPRSGLPCSYVI